jgi:uncharacterized membrane protein YhaH (DUF805 family)
MSKNNGLVWLLFSIRGRANRKQFFIGNLVVFFVCLIPILFQIFIITKIEIIRQKEGIQVAREYANSYAGLFSILEPISYVLWAIGVLIILIPLTAKRLHDLNLTWWTSLIAFLLPVLWVIPYFMAGTKGENKYGYQPE